MGRRHVGQMRVQIRGSLTGATAPAAGGTWNLELEMHRKWSAAPLVFICRVYGSSEFQVTSSKLRVPSYEFQVTSSARRGGRALGISSRSSIRGGNRLSTPNAQRPTPNAQGSEAGPLLPFGRQPLGIGRWALGVESRTSFPSPRTTPPQIPFWQSPPIRACSRAL